MLRRSLANIEINSLVTVFFLVSVSFFFFCFFVFLFFFYKLRIVRKTKLVYMILNKCFVDLVNLKKWFDLNKKLVCLESINDKPTTVEFRQQRPSILLSELAAFGCRCFWGVAIFERSLLLEGRLIHSGGRYFRGTESFTRRAGFPEITSEQHKIKKRNNILFAFLTRRLCL